MPLSDCDAIVADGGLRSASGLGDAYCFRKKGDWARPLQGTALFAALTELADAVSAHAGDDPLAAGRGAGDTIQRRSMLPEGLSRLVAGNGHGPWRSRGCTHSAGQHYRPRPSPQGRAVPPILLSAAEASGNKTGSPTRRFAAAEAVLDPMSDLPGSVSVIAM